MSNDDEGYEVERIEDRRYINKEPMFFLKWNGYESNVNTWEPLSHLRKCAEIMQQFEDERKVDPLFAPVDVFDCGLEPEQVFGVSDSKPGVIYYGIKFVGSPKAEVATSEEVRERIPELVIEFYMNTVEFVGDYETKHRQAVDQFRQIERKQKLNGISPTNYESSLVLSDAIIRGRIEQGYQVEHIKDATRDTVSGDLVYLVEWLTTNGVHRIDPDFVHYTWMNENYPDLVISWFESRMSWKKKYPTHMYIDSETGLPPPAEDG